MTQRWTHRPEGSNWGEFGPNDQLGRANLLSAFLLTAPPLRLPSAVGSPATLVATV